jgi:hypothetical protein
MSTDKGTYKFENVEDIKNFIVGGNATLTLESEKTGRWFTYRIKKLKNDEENSTFFVSVLTASDNEASYTYMGMISNKGKMTFKLTKNSKIGETAMSYKAFEIFFNLLQVNKVHDDMNVYHSGVCCVCGRKITVASSLKNGIGPFCGNFNNTSKNKKSNLKLA